MKNIPLKTQILIIGGGPSGSYAAAALVREGFQVTLLEAVKFPRYHIGESMLPSIRTLLNFIDAEETIKAHGFCEKPGAAIKFNQNKREGYTDFTKLGPEKYAWNVIRSQFDEILLRHAASSGAAVFEEVKVTSILFEDSDPTRRPIAAQYECQHSSTLIPGLQAGTIYFDYLIDASGRAGIMSQKYLKNRNINKSLQNVAVWGYWSGCQRYAPGTSRDNSPWFEALQDETGWAWFIPLHDGTFSVGVVKDQASFVEGKRKLRECTGDVTLTIHYLEELKGAPGVLRYMGDDCKMVDIGKGGGPAVKQAADFSYSADAYAGLGYRLVGDASAFIDPFFSSGVHLGFTSGLSAAATISSSIRGHATEEECARWHDIKVGTAYTRFLIVVLAAYKQMRAQQDNVLSDVNEDNFDRAFDLLRPIIQGTADVEKSLTEQEVQHTLDFVKEMFSPTDPEIEAAVHARVHPKLFGPSLWPEIPRETDLDQIIDPNDEGAKLVVGKLNAQKAVSTFYDPRKDFTSEKINGWTIKLERGELGMVTAA